jgi:hypothetical protein
MGYRDVEQMHVSVSSSLLSTSLWNFGTLQRRTVLRAFVKRALTHGGNFRRQSRVHNTQQWLAISASSHCTKAIGQNDGYSIILLPKVSSSQDLDLDIDAEPRRTTSETQGMEPTTSSSEKHFAGLQECMCFEHVDSVICS